MTNRRSTKSALFTSVVAIMLCCTMLLGTTFAWFTDTATSSSNVITAGNLDMKVSYKPYGAANTTWTELKSDSVVLGKDALYEPGYTEAVWIKVENAGSLAFRYQMSLDVISETAGVNQAGEKFELSDYLVVKHSPISDYDEAKSFYTTRASLDGLANTEAISDGTAELFNNGVLLPEQSWYYLVVLQMPTTVGNEANHNGTVPKIEFGLTALATQVPSKEDTFGSDYDADAEYPDKPVIGPKADVVTMGTMPTVNGETLDTAYTFTATETADQAAASEYADWHADFVVYTDKDVAEGTIMLAGQYEEFSSEWLGFPNEDYPVAADTEIRLLADIGALLNNGTPVTLSYEELCDWVKVFNCGAADISNNNALDGTTLTVELRLYETYPDSTVLSTLESETGRSIVIGRYSYTF